VPPEKTVPEREAVSKGRVGLAMHKSKERYVVAEMQFTFQLRKHLDYWYILPDQNHE